MNLCDEKGRRPADGGEEPLATQELRRLTRDRKGHLRDERPRFVVPPIGSGATVAVAPEAEMSAKKPGFATTGYIDHCDGSFCTPRGSVAFRGLGPPAALVYLTSSLRRTCVKKRQHIVGTKTWKRSIS